MRSTFGRLDLTPAAADAPAEDPAAPPSPAVLRELHADLVRQKRRAFLTSSPLLLLAGFAWAAAIVEPKQFGGLAFLSVMTFALIGQIGYQWLTLRRADPLALYEREQRDAEERQRQQTDHAVKSAAVRPQVTIALTACIVAVTIVEFAAGPLAKTVPAAALVKPAVRAGEWWRLLTASYMHGNLLHIFFNGSALMMLGGLIETYDRRARVPLVYLVAAIGGNILSTVLIAKPALGASGGVLGLAGYLLVVSGGSAGRMPVWIRRKMLSILASTALMGLAAFIFIDNAAHLGGVLAGAAIGLVARHTQTPQGDAALNAAGWIAAAVLVAGAGFTIIRLLG